MRWLVKLEAAAGDSVTRKEFEAWRARDSRHAIAFEQVAGLWDSPELRGALALHRDRGDFSAPVQDRTNANSVAGRSAASMPRWGTRVAALAAVLLLAVAIARFAGLDDYLNADYVTATGQQRSVILPDGSTMMLNSASAVAVDFDGPRRTIRLLQGEAYFEVASDPARPFRVLGHYAEVEAIGTAFSVRAAEERDDIVLEEGHVAILPNVRGAQALTLSERQSLAVSAAGAGVISPANLENDLAWVQGRIRFENRPLGQVLDELRRYHRGFIVVAKGHVEQVRVSGNYRLDNPALIVASLAEAVGATLTRLSDHVLILH